MITDRVIFERKDTTNFFPVLRQRVQSYFAEKGGTKHATVEMVFKTIFILGLMGATYGLIIAQIFPPIAMLLLCIVLGITAAMVGLNIGHDAIHGAYSGNPKVNKLMGLWFNIIGANDHMWRIKHNVLHHTYTNIPGHDDDINQPKVMRLSPAHKRNWYHRYQHIYVFFLYPLATLSWVFWQDYLKFFTKKLGSYDNSRPPRKELLRLFTFKAVYYAIFLVTPLIVISLPWYQILLGFLLFHFAQGMMLTIVFQMAHLVEDVEFPETNDKGEVGRSWAVHQMHTTANFSNRSRLMTFIVGGLNYQIEHHLFPHVCHVHYRKIKPIVMQTAEEYGLPYVENKTIWHALASHVRFLKRMGKYDEPAERRKKAA